MSPTVDFTDWAIPDLVLTLGGREYRVPPPSVDRARLILACAVRAEVAIGLAQGPVPPEITAILTGLDDTPLGAVTMGQDVYDRLVADGHPPATIERMAYYALHYWARGQNRADAVALALWTPAAPPENEAAPAPKGRRR